MDGIESRWWTGDDLRDLDERDVCQVHGKPYVAEWYCAQCVEEGDSRDDSEAFRGSEATAWDDTQQLEAQRVK